MVTIATGLSAIWRCPRCLGKLARIGELLECRSCHCPYPLVGEIPDLRIEAPAWVDTESDRGRARSLLALSRTLSARDLAFRVFRSRQGWSDREAEYRVREAMGHPERLTREFDTWLRVTVVSGAPILDLGCGSGGLLAALAGRGASAIGIDVSAEWLVVAQRFIAERGGTPVLAVGVAEALPLRTASIGALISLDVIEHVGDQGRYLREIDRVLVGGGVCALATPNRFSCTPEPHVGLWGVGWLPRARQQQYVKWRAGKGYEYCRLLSLVEIRRLFVSWTSLRVSISPGLIPAEEMRHFSAAKALLARAYNRIAAAAGMRGLILTVCPFFRVVARKPPSARRSKGGASGFSTG